MTKTESRIMTQVDFNRGYNGALFNLGYVSPAETMTTLVKDLNMHMEDAFLCTCAAMVTIKQMEKSDDLEHSSTIPPPPNG